MSNFPDKVPPRDSAAGVSSAAGASSAAAAATGAASGAGTKSGDSARSGGSRLQKMWTAADARAEMNRAVKAAREHLEALQSLANTIRLVGDESSYTHDARAAIAQLACRAFDAVMPGYSLRWQIKPATPAAQAAVPTPAPAATSEALASGPASLKDTGYWARCRTTGEIYWSSAEKSALAGHSDTVTERGPLQRRTDPNPFAPVPVGDARASSFYKADVVVRPLGPNPITYMVVRSRDGSAVIGQKIDQATLDELKGRQTVLVL